MSQTNEPPRDDLVSSALAAMRRIPPEEVASPEVLDQTLDGIRGHLRDMPAVGHLLPGRPRPNMTFVASGALAAVLFLMVFALVPSHRTLAFEQVVQRLRSAERLSFTMESGDSKNRLKTRAWIFAPDKERTEWDTPVGKTVFVRNGAKILSLDITKKTAEIFDLPNGTPFRDLREQLVILQDVLNKDARSLGDKTIGGIRAKGFEVSKNGQTIELWANAETGDPIRIETSRKLPQGQPAVETADITDFRFDEPMAESLFSLQVPDGYALKVAQPHIPLSVTGSLVSLLRRYAEKEGGAFPPILDNSSQNIEAALGLASDQGPQPVAKVELGPQSQFLDDFLKASKPGEHFQYFPGAKLGDKEELVFWCIDPPYTIFGDFQPLVPDPDALSAEQLQQDLAKDVKYLGIYGDLRVEPLKREQVPGLK